MEPQRRGRPGTLSVDDFPARALAAQRESVQRTLLPGSHGDEGNAHRADIEKKNRSTLKYMDIYGNPRGYGPPYKA